MEWAVTTWNIYGRGRPRVRELARVLAAESADVIALQEVRWWQARRLGITLRMKCRWRRKHYPFTRLGFPLAEGAAILTTHELAYHGVGVVSTETSTSTYRRRIAQWAVVERSGDVMRVFNVHLSPENLADERRLEADRIAALIDIMDPAVPTVVAGDLNDDRDPAVIAALPGIEVLSAPPTNPATEPTQALDHVLVPPGAGRVSTTVPTGGARWEGVSDHLPVTVRFTLDG